MGAVSGAFAAAATTPLDVIKTTMMCTAASRPSMASASRAILAQGGPKYFFRCCLLSLFSACLQMQLSWSCSCGLDGTVVWGEGGCCLAGK